jgi:uncharacterized protein (DUF1499 family)
VLDRFRWIPGALLAAARLRDAPAPPPPELGARDGALAPCRFRTNCVRSGDPRSSRGQAPAPGERPPIPYLGTRAETERALLDAVSSLPGARVVERRGDYVRAECRTRVLRFVDDLELLFDDARAVVHFRSASRVGRNDFGVNRERVAELQRAVDARRPR